MGHNESKAASSTMLGAELVELPDVITVDELSTLMRISRASAYRFVVEHRLGVRIGRRIVIPKSRVVALLDGGKM